jgi:hypothetical protein
MFATKSIRARVNLVIAHLTNFPAISANKLAVDAKVPLFRMSNSSAVIASEAKRIQDSSAATIASFAPRNDSTQFRAPAARYARVLQTFPREEGAGNAGATIAPAALCAMKKAHKLVTTGTPNDRHSLRNGLRLIRVLPGVPGFLATIVSRAVPDQRSDIAGHET